MSDFKWRPYGEGFVVYCDKGDVIYTFSAQWANFTANMYNAAELDANGFTGMIHKDGHVLPFRRCQ